MVSGSVTLVIGAARGVLSSVVFCCLGTPVCAAVLLLSGCFIFCSVGAGVVLWLCALGRQQRSILVYFWDFVRRL